MMSRTVLVLILLYACGEERPSAEKCNPAGFERDYDSSGSPSAYLPLNVGNRWIYRECAMPPCHPDDNTDIKEIVALEELDGEQTYVVTSTQTSTRVSKRFNWLVRGAHVLRVRAEDSVYDDLVETHDYDPGFLRFSGALSQVGDHLTQSFCETDCSIKGPEQGQCETKAKSFAWSVEATDVSKTVPAGTFSCIEILRQRIDKADADKRYWYADGVGKIYEDGQQNDEELLEYTIVP